LDRLYHGPTRVGRNYPVVGISPVRLNEIAAAKEFDAAACPKCESVRYEAIEDEKPAKPPGILRAPRPDRHANDLRACSPARRERSGIVQVIGEIWIGLENVYDLKCPPRHHAPPIRAVATTLQWFYRQNPRRPLALRFAPST